MISINLDDSENRKQTVLFRKKGNICRVPLYTNLDKHFSGNIQITSTKKNTKYPYIVVAELIGEIEYNCPRKKSHIFSHYNQELGAIFAPEEKAKFNFENFSKIYETYSGDLAEIRYFFRVKAIDKNGHIISEEKDFAVYILSPSPVITNVYTLQIGVMDAVEVDLEYKKIDYDVEDCLTGNVLVQIVNVEIKKIEFYLIKLESYYDGQTAKIKEEVMQKLVLSEGQPKKGQIIPIKMDLGALNLSPTMCDIENNFSVKYFLTLGLIDSNERMFFRKVEVFIRREISFEDLKDKD